MENQLRLRLHNNGKWSQVDGVNYLGNQLENGATTLIVELPSVMFGKSHFLEFIKPSGVTSSTTALTESTDESGIHYVSLDVASGLINERGRYILQYVARDGNQNPRTYKSDVIAIDVKPSINASYTFAGSDPDFINWATREINATKLEIDEVSDALDALTSNFTSEQSTVRGLINAGDSSTLQEAKSYTDSSIAAITELDNDGVINKLKEIAAWINDPSNGASATLASHGTRIADLESNKANASDVYSKNQVYNKAEADAKYLTEHQDISGKADKATTYTKTEVDALLANVLAQAKAYTDAHAGSSTPTYKIYSVSEVGSANGACVRGDDAVGLDYVINSSSGLIDSDFDNEEIYKDIKCVTDDNGNVMIGIPKIYFQIEYDTTTFKKTFRISKGPFTGGAVHPAFIDKSGNEKDWVYVGKYTNVVENGKVYSKTGGTTGNISYTNCVSQCLAQGNDYFMMDYWIWSLLQILFTVEFATTNSQSIMRGNVSGSRQTTGQCDSLGDVATGWNLTNNCMVYRGIENLWGNVNQWINGFTFNNHEIWVCYDRSQYVVEGKASPYVKVSYNTNPNGSGNSSKHGFDEDNPLIDFSVETNGSDYDNGGYWYDFATGGTYPCLYVGGDYGSGSYVGLWFASANGSTYASVYIGGRLASI